MIWWSAGCGFRSASLSIVSQHKKSATCHQMSEHAWNDEMQIQLKVSASIAFLSFCCYLVLLQVCKAILTPWPSSLSCEEKRFEANMLSSERMTTAGRFSKRRTCHRCKLAGGPRSLQSRSGSTCVCQYLSMHWSEGCQCEMFEGCRIHQEFVMHNLNRT